MFRISPLVLVFIFAVSQASSYVPRKIFITLYYESKCPDSKDFIIEQLQPTVNLLHEYLMLKLVPFGKARSINERYNGFECQHGPSECTGNMVQSCALDLMQERNDLEKVSYVACEMETRAGTRRNMECAIKAGLHPERVEKCINSATGVSLQLDDEHMTKLVRPNFIPTITIDGVFNQQVQNSALEDFLGTLCSMLKNVPQCASHYNKMALRYILL